MAAACPRGAFAAAQLARNINESDGKKIFSTSVPMKINGFIATSALHWSVAWNHDHTFSTIRDVRNAKMVHCMAQVQGLTETTSDSTGLDEEENSGAKDGLEQKKAHTDSFENLKTEEDVYEGIRREIAIGRLPPQAGPGMETFFRNYRDAVVSSGVEDAEALAVRVMASVFDRIMVQFEDPFTFPSHHTRILAPYNYYDFGQNYVRPLVDYRNSYLGNRALFDTIQQQLQEGANVVLLANHQTEADPAVLALLLEHSHPSLATDLTYIAGDRVVLDPFCKPFSMGRNLLCIYSKKRINDDPNLTEKKLAANRRTLKEMAALFKKGGNLIWVAPSGGRDRPNPETDQWEPAAFDPSAVELMRRLVTDAAAPGHLYPMALLCHDIMPPPKTLEKELGETRLIGHSGIGISVGPEITLEEAVERGNVAQGDKKGARIAYSDAVFASVVSQYQVLENAIHGKLGFGAASPDVTLHQPWFDGKA